MVRLEKSQLKICLLEKLAVNFALPFDLVYHTIRSSLQKNQYSNQTIAERAKQMWQGKIDKYHKLRLIKSEYNGKIPVEIRRVCHGSPCGYLRMILAYLH